VAVFITGATYDAYPVTYNPGKLAVPVSFNLNLELTSFGDLFSTAMGSVD